MKIDISRLNLLEKDIEDWLYENPNALPAPFNENLITEWIGRQYALPSGIADLIGIREDKRVVVVEIKNVAINKAAVLQVCRYHSDLQFIVSSRMDYPHTLDWGEPIIDKILVGPSVDNQTFCEAQAVGVEVVIFSANLTLDLSRLRWSHEHSNEVTEQRNAIAERPEWAIFGITIDEDLEQRRLEREREGQVDFAIEQVTDEYDALMDAAIEAANTDNTDDDEGGLF